MIELERVERCVATLRETEPPWLLRGAAVLEPVECGYFTAVVIARHLERVRSALRYLGPRRRGEPEFTHPQISPIDTGIRNELVLGPRPVEQIARDFLEDRARLGVRRDTSGHEVTPLGDLRYHARLAANAMARLGASPIIPIGRSDDGSGRGQALLEGVHKLLPYLGERTRCDMALGIHGYCGLTKDDEIALFARILHHPSATPRALAFLEELASREMLERIKAHPPPPEPEPEPDWVTDDELAAELATEQEDQEPPE